MINPLSLLSSLGAARRSAGDPGWWAYFGSFGDDIIADDFDDDDA